MAIRIDPPEYLFPVKILTSRDSNFNSYKDGLIKWMIDYSYKNPTYERSNYGGYQSPDNFFLEESFAPYLNIITEHVMETLEAYCDDDDILFNADVMSLCNMWFNFNYTNCYNVQHSHPGCILAGCLWVQIPEEKNCSIVFEDTDIFQRAEFTTDTNRIVEPIPGDIVLFPSYLPHRVDINRSEETRISIAFNLDRVD